MTPRAISTYSYIRYPPVGAVLRSRVDMVADLLEDRSGQQITVEVQAVEYREPTGERGPLTVMANDKAGDTIRIAYFHRGIQAVRGEMPVGQWRRVSGRLTFYLGQPSISNPARAVSRGAAAGLGGSDPIYTLTRRACTSKPVQTSSVARSRAIGRNWRDSPNGAPLDSSGRRSWKRSRPCTIPKRPTR
jgi:RecG-like helicase